jgi:3-deoxy-D-manno-octulosonate 8-phosphate phosphatase (KDO 8-P phosphatase)
MSIPFGNITTFIFDVDGVLTDGSVWSYAEEEYVRRFYIKDGYAIEKALQAGYQVAIISGGNEPGVKNRLSFLGVKHIHLGIKDKKKILKDLALELNCQTANILYMGDDIPDIQLMKEVGLPCCPSDAASDAKNASLYISAAAGGRGAVRDVIEKVMRVRGDWKPEQW